MRWRREGEEGGGDKRMKMRRRAKNRKDQIVSLETEDKCGRKKRWLIKDTGFSVLYLPGVEGRLSRCDIVVLPKKK